MTTPDLNELDPRLLQQLWQVTATACRYSEALSANSPTQHRLHQELLVAARYADIVALALGVAL